MHPRLICLIALACLSSAAVPAFAADPPPPADYKVGDKLAAPTPSATPGGDLKTVNWNALVPKDWDPMKAFRDQKLDQLKDGDPRAQEMMTRMRQAMQSAPTVPALDGQRVRIAGFLVPLESNGDKLREFLLVPYFGACIHTPPPPSNQVIHVVLAQPVQGLRMMDAIWVGGVMRTESSNSSMGASGYRLEGEFTEPYRRPARPASAP